MTAVRYNDPIYDLEGSSTAFRITQHAGEKVAIGGCHPCLHMGWGVMVEKTIMAVLDLVESEPTC